MHPAPLPCVASSLVALGLPDIARCCQQYSDLMVVGGDCIYTNSTQRPAAWPRAPGCAVGGQAPGRPWCPPGPPLGDGFLRIIADAGCNIQEFLMGRGDTPYFGRFSIARVVLKATFRSWRVGMIGLSAQRLVLRVVPGADVVGVGAPRLGGKRCPPPPLPSFLLSPLLSPLPPSSSRKKVVPLSRGESTAAPEIQATLIA